MIEIIPAIDIIEGKCVRLTQGDYQQKKIYNENPLEIAKQFEDAGLRRLHLVDLDGAKASHIVNYKVLEKIAVKTNLKIDFGGGLKSDEDLRIAFESGANQITGGSIAVKNREVFVNWINKYGSEKIILGADVKHESQNDETKYKIAISGWKEKTDLDLFEFLKEYIAEGVQYVICTDISKDGLLEGTSMELYEKMKSEFPDLKFVASGGVTTIDEIHKLNELGVYGAIIGKAIYENKITLDELRKFNI